MKTRKNITDIKCHLYGNLYCFFHIKNNMICQLIFKDGFSFAFSGFKQIVKPTCSDEVMRACTIHDKLREISLRNFMQRNELSLQVSRGLVTVSMIITSLQRKLIKFWNK